MHRHEERDARDDERGEPGRDVLLGERDRARLDDEQEAAHDRGGAPLAQSGPLGGDLAAARRPGPQEDAGDEEPHREHEQRRQRALGDVDAEVRRSPDDVDDCKCGGESHGFSVPTPALLGQIQI